MTALGWILIAVGPLVVVFEPRRVLPAISSGRRHGASAAGGASPSHDILSARMRHYLIIGLAALVFAVGLAPYVLAMGPDRTSRTSTPVGDARTPARWETCDARTK
jgi:hypothetical protein